MLLKPDYTLSGSFEYFSLVANAQCLLSNLHQVVTILLHLAKAG